MGAKERWNLRRAGEKAIKAAKTETLADVETLANELLSIAEDISGDYEDTRSNLSESQGLLDRWEENNGEGADAWSDATSEFENFDVADYKTEEDDTVDEDTGETLTTKEVEDVEGAMEALMEIWEPLLEYIR